MLLVQEVAYEAQCSFFGVPKMSHTMDAVFHLLVSTQH